MQTWARQLDCSFVYSTMYMYDPWLTYLLRQTSKTSSVIHWLFWHLVSPEGSSNHRDASISASPVRALSWFDCLCLLAAHAHHFWSNPWPGKCLCCTTQDIGRADWWWLGADLELCWQQPKVSDLNFVEFYAPVHNYNMMTASQVIGLSGVRMTKIW